MRLIDTHSHLYLEEFATDIEAVLARAEQTGVAKIYLPSIDSAQIDAMLQLEAAYPGKCIAMMGLHPCYVKDDWQLQLAMVEQWLQQRRFAAIGEIGLDFYWDTTFSQQQYEAFNTQMQWAIDYNLPIVIHSRNAMQETIDTVKPFIAKGLRGIFHCFSGNAAEAQQVIELGFYLGIGGVVTYKNAGLAEALANIPLEKLVLETDAPYLTPVPYRGKRNESSYLPYIATKLAEVKQVPVETIAAVTTENAEKIFGS